MDTYRTTFHATAGLVFNISGVDDDENYLTGLRSQLTDITDWTYDNDGQSWNPINNSHTLANYNLGPASWFPSMVKIIKQALIDEGVSVSSTMIPYTTDIRGEEECGILNIIGTSYIKKLKIIDTRITDTGNVERTEYKYRKGNLVQVIEKANDNILVKKSSAKKYDHKLQQVNISCYVENNLCNHFDYIVINTGYLERIVTKVTTIENKLKKYAKENDDTPSKVSYIAPYDFETKSPYYTKQSTDLVDSIRLLYNNELTVEGSIGFKINSDIDYKKLVDMLRDLDYCAMFDVNSFSTFLTKTGKHVLYVDVGCESG